MSASIPLLRESKVISEPYTVNPGLTMDGGFPH